MRGGGGGEFERVTDGRGNQNEGDYGNSFSSKVQTAQHMTSCSGNITMLYTTADCFHSLPM